MTGPAGPSGGGGNGPGLPPWADEDTPVFVISIAAEFSGMHAQTLRSYDRIGLVRPGRSRGGGRRYSVRDIALLREVQRLSQEEGVNLAGIKRIIELEREVDALGDRLTEVTEELARARARIQLLVEQGVPADQPGGPARRADLLPTRRTQSVVVWQPRARPRPEPDAQG